MVQIMFPHHNTADAKTNKPTKKIIRQILISSKCNVVREKKGKRNTTIFFAEKRLRNGRLHINASYVGNRYVLEVHFDSEHHLTKPRRIVSSLSRSYSLSNNPQVKKFFNTYVIPVILHHRKHYSILVNDKWIARSTLLK